MELAPAITIQPPINRPPGAVIPRPTPARMDPIDEEILDIEEELFSDLETYAAELLQIRPKEGGRLIPLQFNDVQKYIRQRKQEAVDAGKKRLFLILKARRFGATTGEQADTFHRIATIPNYQALTLAHEAEAARKIFRISTTFYNHLPAEFQPGRKYSSTRDLNFEELNSLHYVGTAGAHDVGRGDTLQKVHGSEVAFWPEPKATSEAAEVPNLVAALLEAASHGEVVFESTPNGVGNYFYRECMQALEGDSEFTLIFLPWFIDDTYQVPLSDGETITYTAEEQALADQHPTRITPEKIKWRREKKTTLRDKFPQEYPEDPITCFLTSGLRFFMEEDISAALQRCDEPIETREDGAIVIWHRPMRGRRYVAGADVGEGLPKGDKSVCKIIDWETAEEVAVLRGRWRPEIFARKAAELCREYFHAFLGVEANNHGHSTLNTLEHGNPNLGVDPYPNLYRRPTPSGEPGHLGWYTDGKTRPILLDNLESAIRNQELKVNDQTLLAECRAFVLQNNGKYEAGPSNHDDDIFATGIAWQMRHTGGGEFRVYGSSTFTPGEKAHGNTAHI